MNDYKIQNSNIYPIENKLTKPVQKNEFELSKKTESFVEKIKNSTTETILKFLDERTDKIFSRNNDIKMYHYDNLLFVRSNGEKSIELEQILDTNAAKNIAPKYVTFFEVGNDDFLTVLELSHQKAIPYRQSAQNISEETKQKFKNEIQKMINAGYINREIFTSKDSFFVSNNYKDIIFADWLKISSLSDEEKKQMSERLKDWPI